MNKDTALATADSNFLKALATQGIDVTGMDEAEAAELASVMGLSLQATLEGVDLKPTRLKIQKDICKFSDPANTLYDSIAGVVVLKQKAKGFWPRGASGRPTCRSFDCITGLYKNDPNDDDEPEKARSCAGCPNNAWGSAVNDRGEHTRGKACKETRRIFIAQQGGTVPSVVQIPSTSIGVWDSFISARLAQKITDIAVEVRLSLESVKGAFSYAKLRAENGDPVPGKEQLRMWEIHKSIAAAASKLDMENEDAHDDGFDDAEAPFGGVDVTQDDALAD